MYPDILHELALAWIPLLGDIVGIIVSYEIPPRHIELQSWFSSQPSRVRNLISLEFHCSFARDVRGFETSNLALKKKVAEFCEREITGLTLYTTCTLIRWGRWILCGQGTGSAV
jgi:hypothetical protein